VKAAAAGTYSLCPRVAAVVLVAEATAAAQDNGADARLKRPFGLTKRELEVLALLITGCTNSQMARQLFVSEETIKTHMRHIMEKLMVSDRTEAAVKAVRLGLAQNPVSDLDALPSTRMSDGTE
jgi:DNA-binding NarL/FixJ family response regulator